MKKQVRLAAFVASLTRAWTPASLLDRQFHRSFLGHPLLADPG